jgi:hypothetical protein
MDAAKLDKIAGWFAGRLPDGWFSGAPSVTTDDKQILVVGKLSEPGLPESTTADYRSGFETARIGRFREATRGYRIAIAREAERRFELPVTWGATCGSTTLTFTPGGSGRGEHHDEEAKQVMIHAGRWAMRRWARRFGYGGPPAPGPGRWGEWPQSPGDVQSF